jgi:alpha-beta hydrolase superfamily lysophospholipase
VEEVPVFVLGHSLGGFLTAGSVARDQSGLAGVILMSAPLPERAGLALRARINLLATLNPSGRVPGPVADPSGLSRLSEEISRAATDPLIHQKGTTNLIAATALALADENWELFRHWRVPTLILHGTDDTRVDPAGSRRLFDTIAAEDKILRLVQGGRHELLNDLDRDEVLVFILNWLQKRI